MKRPANIRAAPEQVYKHVDWQGHGHRLITGVVATQSQTCIPFKKALLCARSLKLKIVKEWAQWQEQRSSCQHPLHPTTSLHTRRVARVRAVAGHRKLAHQRVPAIHEGAAVRTRTQAERQPSMEGLVRQRLSCQHPLCPRRNLQARRLARLRALARHWQPAHQRVPSVQGGATACTHAQAEEHERVGAMVQEQGTARQHAVLFRPSVRARRVARLRALAGHQRSRTLKQCLPAVDEGNAHY